MLNHVMVGSNDIERSKRFYDAVLGVLGAGEPMLHKAPTGHTRCSSPEQVRAFHEAGLANGGSTCEDPPGERDGSLGRMFVAYVRDPDGNKLCAIHRMK